MLVAPGQPKVATGRDGRVYMFDAGSSAEVFDPPTFTWHAISPDPTTGDYFSLNGSAVASGGDGRIYIAGGRDCASCASTKVRAYDPGTDTYVGVASMHVGRVRAAAATGRDGKVYMFGGDDGNFSLASAEVYDPQLNSWLVIASTLVARSGAAAATASDGRIFLIGGSVFDQGGHGLASSVEAYSPTTNTWSFVASLPAGRFGHSASTGADGWIYVTGGSDDSRPTASVLSYNPVRDLWTTEASLSVVRHNLGGTSGLDGNIYAIGGQDASGQALRSVEWLQTAPDTVFAALTRTGSGQSSYGEEKAFTVKLRSHTGLLPNDGESIDLVAGSTVVGSALLKAGSAIFRIALPVGKYVIHAEYAGNAELPSAISNTSSLQVRKSQTKATLSVTPNPSIFGQDVISRVTIAAVAPGVSTPTGFVTFSIFNPLVGITYETKVAIQDGTANLPIVSDLVVDGHQLIVFYEGDVNYETSGTEVILHVNAPANSAPIANAGGPYGGNEGATITFNAVASSDPDGDPLTYDWNFGDGTVANNAGATPSHAYADNGPFTVTVTVRDALHASVASASVGVGNVSPTVSAIAGAQIIQGGTYSATGSFTDPGADTFNGSVNYGDGSSAAIATGGNAFTLGHTYAVAGTFEVTVSITDDDGGTGSASAFVTVINSPPVAVVGGPYAGNEGSSIAFNASGSADPDGDPLTYDWNFGDGTVEPNSGPTPAHAYADNGAFNATVTVHDDHGHASTAIVTVTVANVAPSVSTIAGAQILQGGTYSAAGSFTDPGADTFTGSVNYGDGSSAAIATGGNAFTVGHTYAVAGTFTVTVSITDDDGGAGTSSATVTVLSPAGATQVLAGTVQTLLTSGAITGQTASQLTTSLNSAVASLAAGKTTAATGQLGSFINKVQAGMNSGKISAANGAALIAFAQQVLNSI
jgi:hypothetical protein